MCVCVCVGREGCEGDPDVFGRPGPLPDQTVSPLSCRRCPQAHPHHPTHPPAPPPLPQNLLCGQNLKAYKILHKRVTNRRMTHRRRSKPQVGLGASHKPRTQMLSSTPNGSCPLLMLWMIPPCLFVVLQREGNLHVLPGPRDFISYGYGYASTSCSTRLSWAR